MLTDVSWSTTLDALVPCHGLQLYDQLMLVFSLARDAIYSSDIALSHVPSRPPMLTPSAYDAELGTAAPAASRTSGENHPLTIPFPGVHRSPGSSVSNAVAYLATVWSRKACQYLPQHIARQL